MVKKIKKYVKFVVCMALIMGLIAPSYAALSASDGSAFVTKAEFDSALADFNARLTTFEAGINSKIDSQVTSYLDRNGIWNGKAQSFRTSDITIPGFPNNKLSLQDANGTFVYDKTLSTETVIEQINKSGLLYFDWSYWCNASSPNNSRWGFAYDAKGEGTWFTDAEVLFQMFFVEKNGGVSSVINSYILGVANGSALRYKTTDYKIAVGFGLPLNSSPARVSNLMFVTKGSSLQIEFYTHAHGFEANVDKPNFQGLSGILPTLKIISAFVY